MEALWVKIIGVLLILVGLTILASPFITYSTREKVIHTDLIDVTAKREKAIIIPRIFGFLAVGAGVVVFAIARRRSQ